MRLFNVKNIEEICKELEHREPLNVAFHSDADGVYSLALVSTVYKINQIISPPKFGDYNVITDERTGEKMPIDLSLDFGQSLHKEWKGISIDHHSHIDPWYKLVWDNCVLGTSEIIPVGNLIAIHKLEVETKLVELQTETGRRLKLTKDHPVFSNNKWIEAKNLKEGNSIKLVGDNFAWKKMDLKGNGIAAKELFETLKRRNNETTSKEELRLDNRESLFYESMQNEKIQAPKHPIKNIETIRVSKGLHSWNNRWRRLFDSFSLCKKVWKITNKSSHQYRYNSQKDNRIYIKNSSSQFLEDEGKKGKKGGLENSDKGKKELSGHIKNDTKASYYKETPSRNNGKFSKEQRKQDNLFSIFKGRTIYGSPNKKIKWLESCERISKINSTDFKGTVYDFSTTSEIYLANNFIVHNCPTGLIVYNIFKDKIPDEYKWKVAGALVGDGQSELVPDEIWDMFPELLETRQKVYSQYGQNKLSRAIPLYRLLSSPVNAMCRMGDVIEVAKLTRIIKSPLDVICHPVMESAKEQASREVAKIHKEYPIITLSNWLGVLVFKSNMKLAGRIASELKSIDFSKTYIVINDKMKEMSIRGDQAGYIGRKLEENGISTGGHPGYFGASLEENQDSKDVLKALRKSLK